MRLKTINSSKITWTIYPSDSWQDFTAQYCADGDGMLTVKHMRDGSFIVDDQGEILSHFDNLTDALEVAQSHMLVAYPWVYEESQHYEGEEA
jgi:hypothetical protein